MQKKIIFFILALLFSQFCIYYVNHREKNNMQPQLNDPLIDSLPFFDGFDKIYDLTLLPPFFLTLMFYDKLPVGNLLTNINVILILRGLCILTTSIPKLKTCQIDPNDKGILLSGGCYDKIFSGHLAFIITMILYLVIYTDQKNYKYIYYFYIVLASFLSLITESHYTIDILISWILSTTLFFMLNKNLEISSLI